MTRRRTAAEEAATAKDCADTRAMWDRMNARDSKRLEEAKAYLVAHAGSYGQIILEHVKALELQLAKAKKKK